MYGETVTDDWNKITLVQSAACGRCRGRVHNGFTKSLEGRLTALTLPTQCSCNN